MMYVFFTYLYICCFFSIFIRMFLYVRNIYFCFTHDALMSFVKCFRKKSCEILSCQELFSSKFFQEFIVGIDLFCNTASGYELSNLRLFS